MSQSDCCVCKFAYGSLYVRYRYSCVANSPLRHSPTHQLQLLCRLPIRTYGTIIMYCILPYRVRYGTVLNMLGDYSLDPNSNNHCVHLNNAIRGLVRRPRGFGLNGSREQPFRDLSCGGGTYGTIDR